MSRTYGQASFVSDGAAPSRYSEASSDRLSMLDEEDYDEYEGLDENERLEQEFEKSLWTTIWQGSAVIAILVQIAAIIMQQSIMTIILGVITIFASVAVFHYQGQLEDIGCKILVLYGFFFFFVLFLPSFFFPKKRATNGNRKIYIFCPLFWGGRIFL